MSSRMKEEGTMNNSDNKVDDEIIEVEMILFLGWVVCGLGGARVGSEMVGGGWRCFESDGIAMSDGLMSWLCMGWSRNTSMHGGWREAKRGVVL